MSCADTFELYQIINGTNKKVSLDGKGISWWTDYNIKYRNPSSVNGSFASAFDGNLPYRCNVIVTIGFETWNRT